MPGWQQRVQRRDFPVLGLAWSPALHVDADAGAPGELEFSIWRCCTRNRGHGLPCSRRLPCRLARDAVTDDRRASLPDSEGEPGEQAHRDQSSLSWHGWPVASRPERHGVSRSTEVGEPADGEDQRGVSVPARRARQSGLIRPSGPGLGDLRRRFGLCSRVRLGSAFGARSCPGLRPVSQ